MTRLIRTIETIGDWSAEFAEHFNHGIVEAVESVAGWPSRLSGWSLDGLTRSLFALGRAIGGLLRVLMFYLPAVIVAATGQLAEKPSWLKGAAVYAVVVTVVGVAGYWRATRR